MNTETISKALDLALIESREYGWQGLEDKCLQALAELDAAPKVLTDEQIELIADVEHVESGNRMSRMWRDGFVSGLQYARDNGYLAPAAPADKLIEAGDAMRKDIMSRYAASTDVQAWDEAKSAMPSPPPYAKPLAPAAGLKVEEVMQCIDDYFYDARFDIPWDILHRGEGKDILRARLTAAIDAKQKS